MNKKRKMEELKKELRKTLIIKEDDVKNVLGSVVYDMYVSAGKMLGSDNIYTIKDNVNYLSSEGIIFFIDSIYKGNGFPFFINLGNLYISEIEKQSIDYDLYESETE